LARILSNINKSNLKADKDLVCTAVQNFYKTLNESGAVKAKPVEPKKEVKKEEPKKKAVKKTKKKK